MTPAPINAKLADAHSMAKDRPTKKDNPQTNTKVSAKASSTSQSCSRTNGAKRLAPKKKIKHKVSQEPALVIEDHSLSAAELDSPKSTGSTRGNTSAMPKSKKAESTAAASLNRGSSTETANTNDDSTISSPGKAEDKTAAGEPKTPSPVTIPLVTPPTVPQKNPPPVSPQTKKKKGVPHVYHDYSSVPDNSAFVRKKTGGVTKPFPEKLHDMLSEDPDPTTVTWLPHGRAFIVRKPKLFTTEVMPKFFKQSKLTSFQRQLNLYGFRRITQGADAGAYYHELFLRSRRQLCMRMNRQKVKGTGHKQPADAQTEPNFYAMPSLPGNPALPWTSSTSPDSKSEHQHVPDSPGIAGLHGAAHLLKGIAAGMPPGWAPLTSSATTTHPTSAAYSTSTGETHAWSYASSSPTGTSHKPASFYPQDSPTGSSSQQEALSTWDRSATTSDHPHHDEDEKEKPEKHEEV